MSSICYILKPNIDIKLSKKHKQGIDIRIQNGFDERKEDWLRGLDGRGHFLTKSISFGRRAMYKYIESIQNLNLKCFDIFFFT